MDLLDSFEHHWFVLSVVMLLLVYWFGLVSDLNAILPAIPQIFYAGSARNAQGNFAAYPANPKAA
jgi:hypothetical protein